MRLLNHITDRQIAMTAPVEFDYSANELGEVDAGSWTMSFVYRTPELGDLTDEERARVRVVDTDPVHVLAIGTTGRLSEGAVERAVGELTAIAEGLDGWTIGDMRRGFTYNEGKRSEGGVVWGEVQIELVPIANSTGAEADSSPSTD